MSLIDIDPAIHSPVSPDMQPGSAFGNAAIDIEKLEKEIAAQETARREKAIVSGSIGSTSNGTSKTGPVTNAGNKRGLQDVSLETADTLDTLDEPILETIRRDLRAISAKFGQVLFPRFENRDELLRDWDLWGPLFICVALSLFLQGRGDETSPQFTQVFTIAFFGSVALTVNIKLLGGTISFFQSLCVIGYCLLPPTSAAFICSIFLHKYFIPRMIVTAIGFCWATYASMGFLSSCVSEKRRWLIVYPIFLFYFIVSWMILTNS